LLNTSLKEAATAAFRDNARLAEIQIEDRELAAQFYEQIAEQVTGTRAALARLYNLERAKFLRGEVDHIAPTARQFAEESRLHE
jgi:hypothetical protein